MSVRAFRAAALAVAFCAAAVSLSRAGIPSRSARQGLAPGSPGTLAHAIASYHPTQTSPRRVDEGSLPAPRRSARCPADMADVAHRFCVDLYEASLEEIEPDAPPVTHSPYMPAEEEHVYIARSVAGVVPQGYVSGAQAAAACAQAAKRLCQPVEWRSACGGTEGYVYPYGPSRVEGRCNDRGHSPMLLLHPAPKALVKGAPVWVGWDLTELNDPEANQQPRTVALTGAYAGCASDLGVRDMVGNLHEWTADPNGTFQGGYYLDTAQNGEGCAYRTAAHHFGYHDYSTGFRCCRDPL